MTLVTNYFRELVNSMTKKFSVTERFGQRIRTLRNERDLSQEQLAELSGLDRTYISGIERGLRNVALRNIEALAKALEVPMSVLFEDI